MITRYLAFIKQKGSDLLFKGVLPERYFISKEDAVKAAKEEWRNHDIENIYIQEVHLGEYEEVK